MGLIGARVLIKYDADTKDEPPVFYIGTVKSFSKVSGPAWNGDPQQLELDYDLSQPTHDSPALVQRSCVHLCMQR